MMRRSLAAVALCALASCSSSRLYCDPLMATSELDGTLRVTIPPNNADEFNRRVVAFLNGKNFSYESSASDTSLGPPDEAGRMVAFRNIKTIGCTSGTIVWSENVNRADEFIITFHHTVFGDRTSTQKLLTELAETIRPTRVP